ncbi:MAG: hypothetical protein NC131_21610 [Roseburia sp.]|nr:hypothetical protein [Roseburia sp.]
MVILGSFLLGADCSYECTPVCVDNINYAELCEGVYDGIYASHDTDIDTGYDLCGAWDMNTIFASGYDDSINAGNIDFSLSTVSHLAIKRRKVNTFKWNTIFVKKVDKPEDFYIAGTDIFNAGSTAYQYALVPILNNTEGDYSIVEAFSDFEGLFLLEKDTIYGTALDVKCDTQRNHFVLRNDPLLGRYPRAVYTSDANYESGTVEGYFCKFNINNEDYYPEDSFAYRQGLTDFLTNKKPKILKLFDGRMWLVNIDETSISDVEDSHWLHRKTSFGFFESGDCSSEKDLYDAGLTDINSEYWSCEI